MRNSALPRFRASVSMGYTYIGITHIGRAAEVVNTGEISVRERLDYETMKSAARTACVPYARTT
jgi:hypothetical protein